MGDLEVTVTRQARMGGSLGRRGQNSPLPYSERASEAGARLTATLGRWATAIATQEGVMLDLSLQRVNVARLPGTGEFEPIPRPVSRLTASLAARWLGRHPAAIRRCPDAGDLHDEVVEAIGNGYQVVDRPGGEMVSLIEQMWSMQAARQKCLTATEMSRALPTWNGRSVTPAMIRGYATRGRLRQRGWRRAGPRRRVPTYQVGEFLDLLRDEPVGREGNASDTSSLNRCEPAPGNGLEAGLVIVDEITELDASVAEGDTPATSIAL